MRHISFHVVVSCKLWVKLLIKIVGCGGEGVRRRRRRRRASKPIPLQPKEPSGHYRLREHTHTHIMGGSAGVVGVMRGFGGDVPTQVPQTVRV